MPRLDACIEDHLLWMRSQRRAAQTVSLRARDLERLREFLVDRRVADVQDIAPRDLWAFMAHIQEGKSSRTGKLWSKGYVGIIYRNLRAFLKWCKKAKMLDEDLSEYIDAPSKDKSVKEHLQPNEIQALLDAVDTESIYAQPERDRAIIAVLVDTMVRVSALCQLTVEHLNPGGNGGGYAVVVEKGGCEHTLFFSPYSWKAIQSLLQNEHPTGTGPLFVSRSTGVGLTANGVRRFLKNLGKRAGIENVYPHRFRRTGATLRANTGCSSRILMQLGGWKDEAMLKIYVNLNKDELAAASAETTPCKLLKFKR